MSKKTKLMFIFAAALPLSLALGGQCFGGEITENDGSLYSSLKSMEAELYLLPESSDQFLEEKDVAQMPSQVLSYARYELLARKGVVFQSPELAGYFGEQSWYFGFIDEENFPEGMLNEYESANLAFLLQQEESSGSSYELDQEGFRYTPVYEYLIEKYGQDTVEEVTGMQMPEPQEPQTETPTEAPETQEPQTEPPTETPAAQEPQTEAPTETPATQEPQTEPPTEIPAAQEPQTEAPTETPATQEPQTEAPTETPATQEPQTEPPAQPETNPLENVPTETLTVPAPTESNSLETAPTEALTIPENPVSEYIFPDIDSRLIQQSEVDRLSLQAICYAKNEIYARHGRKFLSQELQDYFNSKSWYHGTVEPESFSTSVFNSYEVQNLQVLVNSELALRSDGYQLDQPGYDITLVKTASKDSQSQTVFSSEADEIYLSQDFIFDDSNIRYLNGEELNMLSSKVLCYARYEIYARRGCIFVSQELTDHFKSKDWYYGRIHEFDFSQDLFNSYELANVELLQNYEFSVNPAGYPLDSAQ